MKFFGIVRSAANLLISRYVDNTLNTPNLDEAGNVGVNVVFSGGGGPFVIPFQTDDGSVPTGLVAPVYIPLNYGFNSGTGAWERNAKIIANTDDGTVPADLIAPVYIPLNYGFDGTNWTRLLVNTDNGTITADQKSQLSIQLSHSYDEVNNNWLREQSQRHIVAFGGGTNFPVASTTTSIDFVNVQWTRINGIFVNDIATSAATTITLEYKDPITGTYADGPSVTLAASAAATRVLFLASTNNFIFTRTFRVRVLNSGIAFTGSLSLSLFDK